MRVVTICEKNLPEPLLEYLFENRGSLVIKGMLVLEKQEWLSK